MHSSNNKGDTKQITKCHCSNHSNKRNNLSRGNSNNSNSNNNNNSRFKFNNSNSNNKCSNLNNWWQVRWSLQMVKLKTQRFMRIQIIERKRETTSMNKMPIKGMLNMETKVLLYLSTLKVTKIGKRGRERDIFFEFLLTFCYLETRRHWQWF